MIIIQKRLKGLFRPQLAFNLCAIIAPILCICRPPTGILTDNEYSKIALWESSPDTQSGIYRANGGLVTPAEIARFIGAVDLPESSRLFSLTQSVEYAAYKIKVGEMRAQFQNRRRGPIEEWRRKQRPAPCGKTVFYPFSGPDLLNALLFYPDAERYILIGLENPGRLPDPLMPGIDANSALAELPLVLRTLFAGNFFRTANMAREIGSGPFTGVGTVMLFFLALLDYEALDIGYVAPTVTGDLLEPAVTTDRSIPDGIYIAFRAPGENIVRRAAYFRADLSDNALASNPGLTRFMEAQSGVCAIVKAASYLMHLRKFDDVRNYILTKALCLVNDASGVPFHYLDFSGWENRFFGSYIGPTADFAGQAQPDLIAAFARHGQPMAFPYSYHKVGQRPHMIFSRRQTGNTIGDWQRDGRDDIGETSLGKTSVTVERCQIGGVDNKRQCQRDKPRRLNGSK